MLRINPFCQVETRRIEKEKRTKTFDVILRRNYNLYLHYITLITSFCNIILPVIFSKPLQQGLPVYIQLCLSRDLRHLSPRFFALDF